MSEMKAVGKCCNFEINPTSMMNSPTCKHLMEGVEGAEKKEKYKAIACMTECFYKEKGALNAAGEIVKEKMQALIDSELKDHPEFKAVANASVDKCLEQCESNKIFNSNVLQIFHPSAKKKGNPEGGDTCNKLPFKMNMCLMGEILTVS